MAVNRRKFVRASAICAGFGITAAIAPRLWAADRSVVPKRTALVPLHEEPNMTIRDYLSREARRITDNALRDFGSAVAWRKLISEKRRQFAEMMGLDNLSCARERQRVPVTVTGIVERRGYRIEKLYYESMPKLYVTANLYAPEKLIERAPAVLYVCGHAQNQKVHYQAHARKFAELGFICLIVETVERGEERGTHHGTYNEGCFHWFSRGYSPAAVEMFNGIRGLDLLAARPDVDAARLGVTGISGGGASTWWIAAGDERVKCAAPVCSTTTLAAHIRDRLIDGHCDCMWWNNIYRWDLADVGALIAPRALMIASSERDSIFHIASIREVYRQLKRLYVRLKGGNQLRLVTWPGEHAYRPEGRKEIFSWFVKHLQGKDVGPDKVGDIDDSKVKEESLNTLRVFVDGAPVNSITPKIQDHFITLPAAPKITTKNDWETERHHVITQLRMKTFGHFPVKPPPLDVKVKYEFENGSTRGHHFAFTCEEGWRLLGLLKINKDANQPAPAVLGLCLPNEDRGATDEFLGQIRAPWAKIKIETRGTGDTDWSEQLNWHLRRAAAWTGRTLASLRVWDTLRALKAARALAEVDAKQLSLAARGEMCAVALYAALLDGDVQVLFLESPPATQNAQSQKNGRGAAIEMLHCLRITDLPQVAGLLFPTELVIAGDFPESYEWAERVYAKFGAAEKFHKTRQLSSWRPGG